MQYIAPMKNQPSDKTITIRTNRTILSALSKLADSMDRPRNWIIEEALRNYLDNQAWQVEGIKEALVELDRGEHISHEAVSKKVSALVSGKTKR